MKKIILAFFFIGYTSAFSYISGKNPQGETAFYCPQTINCSLNKLDSCKFDSDIKQHFGELKSITAPPFASSYSFSSAKTSFHTNAIYGECRYNNTNTGQTSLVLEIKPDSNLEAYYKKSPDSSWIFDGSRAICDSSNTTLCPLKNRFGFIIHNVDLPNQVIAAINEKDISHPIPTKIYESIIFDDVLVGCSSEKECVINLLSKDHQKYGSVKINMDTMNILQTDILDKTIEINKVDPHNIELKKTDRERAIYCPAEITCNTNDMNACTFNSDDKKYFLNLEGKLSGKYKKLKFKSIHNNNDSIAFTCEYETFSDQLTLKTKLYAFLNAYNLHPNSVWKISPEKQECITENPENCPLQKSFGFLVNNTHVSSGIYASVKGHDIKGLRHQGYSLIKNTDISAYCTGEKACSIDLLSGKHAKLGSITIDMDTMKILKAESLYSFYIRINKDNNSFYDTVDIGYVTLT